MNKKVMDKAIEKSRKAVEKAFQRVNGTEKPTKRELLLDIHEKMDRALELQEKISRLGPR